MPVSADQSYQDFVKESFDYFLNPVDHPHVYAGRTIRELYGRYAGYDSDPTLPAKIPLAGNALYTDLDNFITNVGARIIRVQRDHWNIMNKAAVQTEYQNRIGGGHAALSNSARRARDTYLHVYPTGTVGVLPKNVTPPPARAGITPNWRIGINVEPNSIAAAAQALMGLMDAQIDIGHIKFSAPGMAGKPDSVIVYLRKRRQTYATIRAAVQLAVAGLNIQQKFSPIWNEFVPGLGEASEPPKNGGSFGTFRCTLAYLAYPQLRSAARTLSLSEYQDRIDDTFEIFGIPRFHPNEQGPLGSPPYDDVWRRKFMRAFASYKGVYPNEYKNRQLTDR